MKSDATLPKRTLGLLEWDYSITAGLNPSPFHSGDNGRLNNWFSGWLTLKTQKKVSSNEVNCLGWMDWNAEYSRVDKSHLHGQNAHGGLQWDSRARKRERGLKWKERVWSLQASKRPLVLWGWQRRKRTDSPNSQTFSAAMRLEERVRKLVLFARLLEKKNTFKRRGWGTSLEND